MKIIKVSNCKDCIHYVSKATWKPILNTPTNTEANMEYTGKDKCYCKAKKDKEGFLGCKYITTVNDNCKFILIPKWCPLEEDRKSVV